MEFNDIDNKILNVLSQYKEGINDKMLSAYLKDVDDKKRMDAINRLVELNRVELNIDDNQQPVYKFYSEEQAFKLSKLEQDLRQEETLVYQLIEQSKDRGIQSQDIKNKLSQQIQGFNTTQLNKILKNLEKKGYIKKLKSIQLKGKQVWMLMEIEPSSEVTGGLVGQESFNLEAIEIIQERIVEYLKKHGQTTYRELSLYIKQMGVLPASQEYKDDHIRQIIQALVYDQKIDQISIGDKDVNPTFKISNMKYPYQVQYSQIPCAHCPVRQECGPNNLINPKQCPYLTEWLSQMM